MIVTVLLKVFTLRAAPLGSGKGASGWGSEAASPPRYNLGWSKAGPRRGFWDLAGVGHALPKLVLVGDVLHSQESLVVNIGLAGVTPGRQVGVAEDHGVA